MKKETVIKLIAAVVVPGGFIMWGIYELGRMVESRKKGRETRNNPDETKDNDS